MMEAVIGMALLGGLAMGFMQIQKSATNAQVESTYTMEQFQVTNKLQQFFLNGNICSATLRGLNLSGASETSPKTFSIIKRELLDADGKGTGSFNDLLEATSGTPKVYMGGRLVLTEMGVVEYTPGAGAGNVTKEAEIKLRFKFAKRKARGETSNERVFYRYVNIKANVGTGNDVMIDGNLLNIASDTVATCYSDTSSAVYTAMKGSCEGTHSFDMSGNPVATMKYNQATGKCEPISADHSYCVFGGSFSAGGNYNNPETGAESCQPGFAAVRAGHFTRPRQYNCGKAKCYDFYQQPFYNCVKCFGAGGGTKPVADTGNIGSGSYVKKEGMIGSSAYGGCTDTVTTGSCSSGTYPYDSDGDGCDDTCIDPGTYFPGGPGGGGPGGGPGTLPP